MDLSKFADEERLIMNHPELQEMSDEARKHLFIAYAMLLVNRKVVFANGNVEPDRYGCYNYISDVIPFLNKEEMLLIQTNPDQFVFRFMFSVNYSKRESSFACWLQNEGILAERTFESIDPSFDRDRVFEEFMEVTGKSPFERFEKHGSLEFYKEYVENDMDLICFRDDDGFGAFISDNCLRCEFSHLFLFIQYFFDKLFNKTVIIIFIIS